MRKIGIIAALVLLTNLSCSNSEQLKADCNKGKGEACNQLGKTLPSPEDIVLFRKACNLGNTNGCVNLSEKVEHQEAIRVLKFSCDKGNTRACAKLAEKSLLKQGK